MKPPTTPRLRSLIGLFRQNWSCLAITDIAFKVLAFVALVPIAAALFRGFVAFSGRKVLADQDILAFLLSPTGGIAIVVLGAIWVAILALEQSALAAVVHFRTDSQRLTTRQALLIAARNAWPVLRLTGQMVVWTILAAVPFLAVAGIVYWSLLTKFDINFYLTKKPPEFLAALALGAVIGAAFLAVFVRMVSGWIYTLPLLLFEHVSPSAALSLSGKLAAGRRKTIVAWIVGWGAANFGISLIAAAIVGGIGTLLIIAAGSVLALVLIAAGGILLLGMVVNFASTLLSTTTFAVMLVGLYQTLDRKDHQTATVTYQEESRAARFLLKLTRQRLVFGSLLALLVAGAIGAGLLQSVQFEEDTLITAHRGASSVAPENTLASIQGAIDQGADYAEIDVQETRDGVVVVVHDSDLKKLGGPGTKIWNATAEDLRKVDIGSWFDPQFSDQRVPTLAEVLSLAKGKIRVNIELKFYGHNDRLEERVAEIVEEHGMQDDIIVMSLEQSMVAKMKSLRPQWTVGLLTAVAKGDLTRLDADFFAVNLKMADRSFIQTAHGRDKQVFAWTVNDPLMMSTMIGRGVNNLITDKPALARSVLEQREEMTSVERLLVDLGGTWSEAVDPDDEPVTQ
ncbi:Glycerophosphoryl diester phosphodiesterase [Symmachiella dynata]|uniref:glycerophosphodiester phosphodiesterase n=1 Tax=Symmachiella dynata TaxID=2527995 RepID=UPI00118D27FE|nr:glycerophosphodiester phosphodiesterase [Symmachiella dynata]QDT46866.1 Glycerophosphoryl diester phosphodiesterase [Symmachiella dynata]